MKTKKPKRGSASAMPPKQKSAPRSATEPKILGRVPALLRVGVILVPTDFSPESEKALRYATAFARQFGARIVLLHVMEPVGGPDFAFFPLIQAKDRVARAARQRLDRLAARFGGTPRMFARPLVREGKAYQVISSLARRLKVNLIVIATHGYTGAARVILGSTTERVVRHAPCPVLVVREGQVEFVQ
jgi:nucleotide-binding universal stress UspA family protein